MKTDRLISIIMVLLERKRISATRLAEMFEVSVRTIFRDIDAINMAGIPIVTYPGVNGGVSIMEGYKMEKKLFTTSDFISILMGLGSIRTTLSNKEIAATLEKFKSLLPSDQLRIIESKSNQIAIDLRAWAGNRNTPTYLETVRRALQEDRHLSFRYSDGSGKISRRKVEPYQLVLKEKSWYLQAYCLLRKDFRVFKLSRMHMLRIPGSSFVPREFTPRPLDGSDWIGRRIITIRLLIDASLREKVADRCGEEYIRPYGENKLLVRLPFAEDDLGYNLLLGYGDKCECLGPERVRREMVRRIKKLLSVYD